MCRAGISFVASLLRCTTNIFSPSSVYVSALNIHNTKRDDANRPSSSRRSFVADFAKASTAAFLTTGSAASMAGREAFAADESPPAFDDGRSLPNFRRLSQKQFVVAPSPAGASRGSDAEGWGLWTVDPGPRGVPLGDFRRALAPTGRGPYGWSFDPSDWWLEEHGIITESPDFPLRPGRYLVTGGRELTTVLTINSDGTWELREGTLYDVTHLPCRSGRYRGGKLCSPNNANRSLDFPVQPGARMPTVIGCRKQDYAVLFVVGIENYT